MKHKKKIINRQEELIKATEEISRGKFTTVDFIMILDYRAEIIAVICMWNIVKYYMS